MDSISQKKTSTSKHRLLVELHDPFSCKFSSPLKFQIFANYLTFSLFFRFLVSALSDVIRDRENVLKLFR